ncbi:hypothetical protein HHK36_030150 [Tetracentron sinense]|uniref:Glycosyltransferase n=1 Tax=Tetracentron sinense TaxID=13715 RepID=A0A834YAX7_TETSI|nr:hypothetical protein HHK36_030150 [Tetracentron sinense]
MKESVMGKPHVLVIPFPTQGHVMPLMELSHSLIDCGFVVTFVNTDFNHRRIVESIRQNDCQDRRIRLVSIPDGMAPGDDRNDLAKLCDTMLSVMPCLLEELILKINHDSNDDDKITFVIADQSIGWALEVAEKMGIRRAAFWPAAGCLLALLFHIPKLIESGIISANGIPIENQMIKLSPEMPAMNTAHFVWLCIGDPATQLSIYNTILRNNKAVKHADYLLCNSFYELEPSVLTLVPNLKPLGPLLGSSRFAHLWPQDSTCLSWLDQQPPRSVIYIAFGSLTILDKRQFDELALGLELSGHRFLWVIRPDLTNGLATGYPDGFEARVADRGMMICWAPQKEVLAHPSVTCFLTHCGWNSTMEGLSMGVPFLCWPYFADQFLNKSYICDIWKVGLGFNPDENGIISKEEINKKVKQIVGDEEIRVRALKLKETAMNSVSEGGSSLKNFEDFVEAMKC